MRPPGPFLALALAAFAVGLATPLMPRAPFASYFGPLPAPVAMLLVAGLGLAALARLQAVGWTPPGWPPPARLAGLAALGAAFALPTVALDIALPFPAGINAPLPEALQMLDMGMEATEINVGGLHFREGREKITDNVWVDEDERRLLRDIAKRGITLEARALPGDGRITINSKVV